MRRSPPCRRRCRGRRRRRPGSRTRQPPLAPARTGRARCRRGRLPPDASRIRFASSWIQRVTSVSAGPPLGGLYLKPPSSGGLCDGVTTMPSARPPCSHVAAVRDEDRVRHRGGRREPVVGVDPDVDPVGRQHLERRPPGGLGQRVRVAADEQRTAVALRGPVAADGLGRGQDVRLVERGLERRAAVARRPEGDPLGRDRRIGTELVVGAQQRVHVDEVRGLGRPSRAGVLAHGRTIRPPSRLQWFCGIASPGARLVRCAQPEPAPRTGLVRVRRSFDGRMHEPAMTRTGRRQRWRP